MIWGQLGVLALAIALFLGTLHLAGHTRSGTDPGTTGTTVPGHDADVTRVAGRKGGDRGPGSRGGG